MKHVDLYIVTSIRGPKKKDGRYLYELHTTKANGEPYEKGNKDTMEWHKDTTENQLTLFALEEALCRIHFPCRLHIWLDSPYVTSVLQNNWIDQWKQNNWTTARGKPVKDAPTWESVSEKIGVHELTIHFRETYSNREQMLWFVSRYVNDDTFQKSR